MKLTEAMVQNELERQRARPDAKPSHAAPKETKPARKRKPRATKTKKDEK